MLTEVTQSETKLDTPTQQFAPLQEAAETIRDNALDQARSKLPFPQRSQSEEELLLRRDFVEFFKHGLAIGVSQVISANDQRVQALYLFEETTNPDAETEENLPVDMTVHLLVLVKSNSAALESFIGALDRAMVQAISVLPLPILTSRTSILNVVPITEDDVENGRGYAVLLTSLFAPPLRIWQRQ